ncbi:hypothetical protein M885DRAFT_56905 [Pelagophyceae sp. CCMP2097]|nr:hypothetical protein M885DRAFT_56905 [Pelagophyceae sp. CCMP2097]
MASPEEPWGSLELRADSDCRGLEPNGSNFSIPKRFVLSKETHYIGRLRDDSVDTLFLPFSVISSVHCVLSLKNRGATLVDRSSNGTSVNGKLVGKHKSVKLSHGDRVTVFHSATNAQQKIEYDFQSTSPPPNTAVAANLQRQNVSLRKQLLDKSAEIERLFDGARALEARAKRCDALAQSLSARDADVASANEARAAAESTADEAQKAADALRADHAAAAAEWLRLETAATAECDGAVKQLAQHVSDEAVRNRARAAEFESAQAATALFESKCGSLELSLEAASRFEPRCNAAEAREASARADALEARQGFGEKEVALRGALAKISDADVLIAKSSVAAAVAQERARSVQADLEKERAERPNGACQSASPRVSVRGLIHIPSHLFRRRRGAKQHLAPRGRSGAQRAREREFEL